ncbi:helix-turn-helix transcriptional regulator [Frankia sp. AgB1.9]|uniref:PadR family transcriptional regulator n=1 Tax=unclassified Frankia TaxID=2632575 RepID=UPI0035A92AFF|nr:helix-turn-helix transcriptional regulator [Frankia sp. AgW1.1]MBL7546829.1 helix-turn-helix transcriptional regulator [Frankia sp. AgB1.9]
MREPTFLVLAALADGPRHGYGVIREVEAISHGRVRLRAGTLYSALDRLAADGLVRRGREEAVDGRLRRYYELTDHGAAALGDQVARLRANAAEADRRLRARRAALTGGLDSATGPAYLGAPA